MGYYIRFVSDDTKPLSLGQIEAGLKAADPAYRLVVTDRSREDAELFHGEELYAELEITRLDLEDVDEEVEELIEDIEEAGGPASADVIELLQRLTFMVVVRVLWQDRDTEATLDRLVPLWDFLIENYDGLLQCDGEGYYRDTELILEVK